MVSPLVLQCNGLKASPHDFFLIYFTSYAALLPSLSFTFRSFYRRISICVIFLTPMFFFPCMLLIKSSSMTTANQSMNLNFDSPRISKQLLLFCILIWLSFGDKRTVKIFDLIVRMKLFIYFLV